MRKAIMTIVVIGIVAMFVTSIHKFEPKQVTSVDITCKDGSYYRAASLMEEWRCDIKRLDINY